VIFSIGDPGRAALEVPDGAPPARIGPADAELSAASLPGMLIRAATCRGLMHRANGTPRQDAFALGHQAGDGSPRLVAVVCDGVGQFGRSDEAALFASRRLADLGVAGTPWPQAFARANEELGKMAREARAADPAESDANGMATTAVAVSAWRDGAGWAGEAAWAGDSTLWHLSTGMRWTPVTRPAGQDTEADYHSTGVRPLPSADGACTSLEFRTGAGALFVMTDGVANPLMWSSDVQSALAEWWTRPPDPFTFAAQVGFARKSHLDDRTVIGIWPDRGEADESQENEADQVDSSG
jgi:Protein phosphatase 2C